MRELSLGKTGLTVSAVGFGGIPIQRLPEEEAVAVVRHCLDLGITFLDTANGYTTSEERIGKAIAARRDGVVLATKTGAREGNEVEKHLALSLERLGVDAIDLYQFHGVSTDEDYRKVVAPGGPLEVVREAQASGQVGHIGLTSHSMQIALNAVASRHFETIMFPFNFIANEAAQELIPLALEQGVAFIAMKPLAGGVLDNPLLAFKYLRQYPGILPIPGIERAGEIEEIVQIMKGPAELTPGEQDEIRQLQAELGQRFCRRCGYCQPCPEGVSIQPMMIMDSIVKRMPAADVFTHSAEIVAGIANCTECGECEEKCPYELPIRDMLNEHAALFRNEMARAGLV